MKHKGNVYVKNSRMLFPAFRKTLLTSLLLPMMSSAVWAVDRTASVTDGSSVVISGDYSSEVPYANLIYITNPGSTVSNSGWVNFASSPTDTSTVAIWVESGGTLNLDGASFNLASPQGQLLLAQDAGTKATLNNIQATFGSEDSLGEMLLGSGGITGQVGSEISLSNSTFTHYDLSSNLFMQSNTLLTGANNTFNISFRRALSISGNATLDNTTINTLSGSESESFIYVTGLDMDRDKLVLNGLTITGKIREGNQGIHNNHGFLNINDGTINQQGGSYAIYSSGGYGIGITVLNNLNVTAILDENQNINNSLIYAIGPITTINGGSYNVTNGIGINNDKSLSLVGELYVHDAQVTTNSDNSIGIRTQGKTGIDNTVITTHGNNSDGLYVNSGDDAEEAPAVVDASNLTIKTEGSNSQGISADHLSIITVADSDITTSGDSANLLQLNELSTVTANNVRGVSTGSGAYGINIQNGSTISLKDSQISTNGANADGIYAANNSSNDPYTTIFGNGDNIIVQLDNTTLTSAMGNGITANGVNLNIDAINGSQITGGNGVLINAITDSSDDKSVTSTVNMAADNQAILTGDIQAEADNIVNVSLANSSIWNGAARNANNINVDSSSSWNLTGDADVASLNLDGHANFTPGNSYRASGTDFSTLTVRGDMTGNGGLIKMNVALGDDNSQSDKLVVQGNTSGDTGIQVNNAGGTGAQTINGIQLVSVEGQSDGNFTLKGRAVAGAYEYQLAKGQNDGGWYLHSGVIPTPDPTPTPDPIPTPVPTPLGPTVRPEAGSYMANMAAANKLFNLRLEDREGRAENSSMWLRQQGDRTKFRDSSGQIKTATNTYVIQGGGEVAQTQFSDTDRLGIGLMLGYGKSDSESRNNRTNYHSKGSVDGYSGGVYATWYQDAKTLNGLYVDSWTQYSLLKGEVNGEQLSGESYDMNGLSASVESGYRLPVYQGENSNVFVTPQAQITWNGIKADDHTEANGTRVTSDGNNNVQTRLGVKLSRDGVSDQDKGSDKLFTVYTEANWLHNTEQAGATMDGVSIKQSGSTNVGELKLGAEGQLGKHINLWTNVAQQLGNNGYSDTALTVGFKYKF